MNVTSMLYVFLNDIVVIIRIIYIQVFQFKLTYILFNPKYNILKIKDKNGNKSTGILVKISKLPLDFMNRKCCCGQLYRIVISLT